MPVVRPLVLRSALVLTGALVCASTSGLAHAGNGIHPRTPVLWDPDTACMTIVDRTVDPKLTLTYSIPYEDLRPADSLDEVDDSRRHQFVAFCKDHSPQIPMPEWLSRADVEAAEGVGIVKSAEVDADNVLAENPEWKDCFVRITGDDERRLITVAESSKPVIWDTTGIPIGAYVVSGYTWEPVFNIWRDRPGLVRVIDDLDPAANPPALVISNRDEIRYPGEAMPIVGCLDAMDGSTITGAWAITGGEGSQDLQWTEFGADTPVSGDSYELVFMPPPETHGESLAIKIEIVDPMDRRYTAHMADLATILKEADTGEGGCTEEGMAFINMPGCDTSGGDTTDVTSSSDASAGTGASATDGPTAPTGPTGDTSDTSGAPIDPGKEGGCGGGCALGDSGVPAALLVGPWLLWSVRRRRRA